MPKRIYNGKFRRANKVRIMQGKEPMINTNEIVSQYDVCDWINDARDYDVHPFGYVTKEEQEQIIEEYKRK